MHHLWISLCEDKALVDYSNLFESISYADYRLHYTESFECIIVIIVLQMHADITRGKH